MAERTVMRARAATAPDLRGKEKEGGGRRGV